jgi:hypothetical protein
MRLTLRTLLAYLDDTLDPAQTREIGAKVAESESVRELVERIKLVTRRRRLTTPDRSGSPEVAVDANRVAEYLDNVLSEEEITELERLCLESDVNLAEASACHQILTVIVSEPANVPPMAYQRMYAIAPGAEAIPHQRPRVRVHQEPEPAMEREAAGPLLLRANGKGSWGQGWWLGFAAALLLVGLTAVIYLALTEAEPSSRVATGFALAPAVPAPMPVSRPNEDVGSPSPTPTTSEPNTQASTTGPVSAVDSLLLSASWLAARPGMPGNWLFAANWPRAELPGNWFLIFGPDDMQPATPAPASDTPAQAPPAATPRPTPPDAAMIRVGTLSSSTTRDSLLFRRDAPGEVKLIRPGQAIQSNEPLLALPGYRSEITLGNNQARVELVGSLPLTMPNYFLESSIMLHPAGQEEVDLTLLRGRVIFLNRPEGNLRIRLRFLDQTWDMRLLEPKSELGVELTGRVPPGAGGWSPHYRLNLVTAGGRVELRRPGKVQQLDARRLIPWDNSVPDKMELLVQPLADVPPWMNRKAAVHEDVRAATARFSKRITDKLGMGGSEANWIRVACQESFEEAKPWERALGLFTLGALDQTQLLLKTLETSDRPDVRVRAMDVLFHWLGRQENQDQPLRESLKALDFSDTDTHMVLRLFQGFDVADRSIADMLIGNLLSPRQTIRELSYFTLHLQVPADKLTGYDPAAPSDVREAAVRAIRTRLMGKN